MWTIARDRRDDVLGKMLRNNLISEAQYEQAVSEPIKLAAQKKPQVTSDYHAPYFVTYILSQELPKIFGQDTDELTYHYGLDVYTSLDPRLQKVAEEAVTEKVEENRSRHIEDGALIAIDPKNGYIKAMVGGINYQQKQVQRGHARPSPAGVILQSRSCTPRRYCMVIRRKHASTTGR